MTVGGRPKRAAVADFRLGGVYVGEALLGRELTGLQPLPDLLHHGGIAGASHNREAALNPVDLQEDRICAPYARTVRFSIATAVFLEADIPSQPTRPRPAQAEHRYPPPKRRRGAAMRHLPVTPIASDSDS